MKRYIWSIIGNILVILVSFSHQRGMFHAASYSDKDRDMYMKENTNLESNDGSRYTQNAEISELEPDFRHSKNKLSAYSEEWAKDAEKLWNKPSIVQLASLWDNKNWPHGNDNHEQVSAWGDDEKDLEDWEKKGWWGKFKNATSGKLSNKLCTGQLSTTPEPNTNDGQEEIQVSDEDKEEDKSSSINEWTKSESDNSLATNDNTNSGQLDDEMPITYFDYKNNRMWSGSYRNGRHSFNIPQAPSEDLPNNEQESENCELEDANDLCQTKNEGEKSDNLVGDECVQQIDKDDNVEISNSEGEWNDSDRLDQSSDLTNVIQAIKQLNRYDNIGLRNLEVNSKSGDGMEQIPEKTTGDENIEQGNGGNRNSEQRSELEKDIPTDISLISGRGKLGEETSLRDGDQPSLSYQRNYDKNPSEFDSEKYNYLIRKPNRDQNWLNNDAETSDDKTKYPSYKVKSYKAGRQWNLPPNDVGNENRPNKILFRRTWNKAPLTAEKNWNEGVDQLEKANENYSKEGDNSFGIIGQLHNSVTGHLKKKNTKVNDQIRRKRKRIATFENHLCNENRKCAEESQQVSDNKHKRYLSFQKPILPSLNGDNLMREVTTRQKREPVEEKYLTKEKGELVKVSKNSRKKRNTSHIGSKQTKAKPTALAIQKDMQFSNFRDEKDIDAWKQNAAQKLQQQDDLELDETHNDKESRLYRENVRYEEDSNKFNIDPSGTVSDNVVMKPSIDELSTVLAAQIARENIEKQNNEVSDLSDDPNDSGCKGKKIWDQWTKWSECSCSCGEGQTIRWRHCIKGNCKLGEKEAQIQACNVEPCSACCQP